MKSSNDMKKWFETTALSSNSSAYLDDIYEQYLSNPESIAPSWKEYFDTINLGEHEVKHSEIREEFKTAAANPTNTNSHNTTDDKKLCEVMDLLYMYRSVGHKKAKTDPLGLVNNEAVELDFDFHNLNTSDLSSEFDVGYFSDYKSLKLSTIIKNLQKIYCDKVGYEYMHLTNFDEKKWLRNHIEKKKNIIKNNTKKWLLEQLSAAEGLEKYLGMKYVSQKRFSIEGGESLIPMLNQIIKKAGENNVSEVVLGMAHRGRLNVLINVMGKSPADLFDEFEGKQAKNAISGDVKYHLGFSCNHDTASGKAVHVALGFNPSHLETVNPVIEGSVRAKQQKYNGDKNSVIPVLMHGDSAFCGQGVVMETLAMSQTRYYGTGGTIHIVSNNQVGFTTNKKEDNRSSLYSTDIAKMIEAPIFHVNSDSPEDVLNVLNLAFEYRMKFNKDVVIDLVCYRRHGHNEADEPSGTQPEMYKIIKRLATTRTIYSDNLISQNIISKDESIQMAKNYRSLLDIGTPTVKLTDLDDSKEDLFAKWSPFKDKNWRDKYVSTMPKKELLELAKKVSHIPESFQAQAQVAKAYKDRVKMANDEIPLNWGMAELLAYGSLLQDGHNLRISGEDTGRGTFSHRYAVLHNNDEKNIGQEYIPLAQVNSDVECDIVDSILSEYGVLGFDYGFSTATPNDLTIWEAQFGDFVNTAQVIIDQFIASAEEKWQLLSGLVMLLPHGQEGAGPEHSSARVERFLQLCAHDNMQVCVPSTPAQIYHLLRRQILRTYRKPLIIMSPKSLLRHHLVKSSIDDLANGTFQCVLPELDEIHNDGITRVIICSGKIYYELLTTRRENKLDNIAIIRVEQLYPFPDIELKVQLDKYHNANDIIWCQEEPENQGAWWMIQHDIRKILLKEQVLNYAGRDKSSSPAPGYPSLFKLQQETLINTALNINI